MQTIPTPTPSVERAQRAVEMAGVTLRPGAVAVLDAAACDDRLRGPHLRVVALMLAVLGNGPAPVPFWRMARVARISQRGVDTIWQHLVACGWLRVVADPVPPVEEGQRGQCRTYGLGVEAVKVLRAWKAQNGAAAPPPPDYDPSTGELVFTCEKPGCGREFRKPRTRGRYPRFCEEHAGPPSRVARRLPTRSVEEQAPTTPTFRSAR